jgi:hypothetical protein
MKVDLDPRRLCRPQRTRVQMLKPAAKAVDPVSRIGAAPFVAPTKDRNQKVREQTWPASVTSDFCPLSSVF